VSLSDSFQTGTPGRCSASPVRGGGAGAGPEYGPPGCCAGLGAGCCATNGNDIASRAGSRIRFIRKSLLRRELELSFRRFSEESRKKPPQLFALRIRQHTPERWHEAQFRSLRPILCFLHRNPSFRPKLLTPLRAVERRNPLLHFSSSANFRSQKSTSPIQREGDTKHLTTQVRQAHRSDKNELAKIRVLLWPESSVEVHRKELESILRFRMYGTLPMTILVSQDDGGALTGFIEIGLRSHADGCDPARPVGFVEGWFVHEASRKRGIGSALMRSAEAWARTQGCREMASDTWIDDQRSIRSHQALGFEVVDRCVHFRKAL
jgi:aminoglycoside 6'-N-acetyltransferase I